MGNRISKIREKLSEENIDGAIIKNPVNVRYLTNLTAEGILLITHDENVFITDGRYIEEVKNSITIEDNIIFYDGQDLNENDYINFFSDCERVGFEEKYMTYYDYTNSVRKYRIKEFTEISALLDDIRTIKDEVEISKIEKACNITDSCFLHLLDFIKEGMTEKEVAMEIYNFFLKNGADGLAFDTIVASGPNSSKPHAVPTERKIQDGDVVLIDFGAKVDGYCADMTRTIFVGSCNEQQEKLYEMLLRIQERSIMKIKSMAQGNEIAKTVQNELNANGYELIHALGHGVGLEIHEKPFVSVRCNYELQENMIITSEPGIYIPGEIGMRIEDTILVTKTGARLLTKSNKNLLKI